jgi:hypothetical protein
MTRSGTPRYTDKVEVAEYLGEVTSIKVVEQTN